MVRPLAGLLILAIAGGPLAARAQPGGGAPTPTGAPTPGAASAATASSGGAPSGLLSAEGSGDEDAGPGDEAALIDEDEAARELLELKAVEAATIDEESRQALELLRALELGGWPAATSASLRDALDLARPVPLVPSPTELGAAALADIGSFDFERARRLYDIPVEMHPLVAEYIRFFQGPGRKHFVRWLGRASRYQPLIRKTLREAGLPQDTIFLAMIESGFSPVALSPAKAAGLWQFIEPTGKRFGLRIDFWVDERRDPVKATVAAAGYLKALYAEFGDWRLAWAGYNAGEGKIRRAIREGGATSFWDMVNGRILKPETKHYVPKLMAAALIAKNLAAFGFSPEEIDALPPLAFDEAEVPEATDLEVIARAAGVSVNEVRELNPELRRWCTPPSDGDGEGFKIKLPAGTRQRFVETYATVAPKDRLTYRVHKIARGETLSHISLRYGTPIEAIVRINRIKDPRRLRLGDSLVIPVPKPSDEAPRQARQPGAQRRGANAHASGSTGRAPRAARGDALIHTVVEGDTLSTVGRRYGVGVEELARWNGLSARRATLRVGQKLRVQPKRRDLPAPSGGEGAAGRKAHVVAPGDTLWSIARAYGVSVADLERWNKLKRRTTLRVGQRLLVSGR
ncbi:MAG: LysM peptidoglycan-binding domain-containing protein [Myxococcales bacterium]|jgi:membrane-bound lytic murein transglycosylase D